MRKKWWARLHSISTREAAPILDVEVCPWSSYPQTYPKQDSVTRREHHGVEHGPAAAALPGMMSRYANGHTKERKLAIKAIKWRPTGTRRFP
jgi:hypothetical protein